MKIIENIRIKYFRSIHNTTRGNQQFLPAGDLNVIVGNNDAGKSNYMRALSLFFNNYSEPNQPFDFWRDFSIQRHGVKKEISRIEIELEINPPEKQYFTHAAPVKWKKTWYEYSKKPDEDIKFADGRPFNLDGKSSYFKWLHKIRFKYVPAIKSDQYFKDLLHDIYEVLQNETSSLEASFNEQIKEKTARLSEELQRRLGISSVLQYRGSFRDLYGFLEFGDENGNTALSQRGDGIKVRHIPIILQTLAEVELAENRSREPKASTIWAFEEPENNLEFMSAKKLADSLLEYTKQVHFEDSHLAAFDEGIQIFITTHSPIFYTLGKTDDAQVKTFFVKMRDDGKSDIKLIENHQYGHLEEEMQLLPMVQLSSQWLQINDELNQKHAEHEILMQRMEGLEQELSQSAYDYDCLFLTEDTDQSMIKVLLEANGFDMERTDIRSYNGCTNLNAIKMLKQFMTERLGNSMPVVIAHRDADYLSKEEIEIERQKLDREGVILFVTKGTDIESYFVSKEHIQICYSDLADEQIEFLIAKAIKEKEQEALKRMYAKDYGPKYKEKKGLAKNLLKAHYEANIDRYFHGKEVLDCLKGYLQVELKENPQLSVVSEALLDEVLMKIAGMIWDSQVE